MAVRVDGERESARVSSPPAFEILDRLTFPLATVDQEGRIRFANRSFAAATGREPADLIDRHLWELLTGDQLADARREVADGAPSAGARTFNLLVHDALNGCQPHGWSFHRVDGSDELLATAFPAPSSPGPAAHDALSRALIEHSPDVHCLMESDGTLVFVSPAVERTLGYRAEELIGINALELIRPEDLDAVEQAIERASAAPGRPEVVAAGIRAADHRWIEMEARGVVHGAGAAPPHILVHLSDITERTRVESALAESEARFRSAFEHTAIGKVIWNADGEAVRVNRAVCEMLGHSEPDLVRMGWKELCHPEDRDAIRPALCRVIAGEVPSAQEEVRALHRDGSWIWIRATVSLIAGNDGGPPHLIGELEDVTVQRTSEVERRGRLERRQAQQTAVVSIATHPSVASGPLDAALRAVTEIATRAAATQRASVWFLEDDGDELRCADLFDASVDGHTHGAVLSSHRYPSYFAALQSDRVIDADDACSDPRTAELRTDYLSPLGISSMLDAPVRIRGRVCGVVCLEHLGGPRVWHIDEVTFAGEVADQVAHAISNAQRTVAELRLHSSEERFRSIVSSIPMGLLMYRLADDSRLVFCGANPAADRILKVSCQRFLGRTIEEAFPGLAGSEIPERYREVVTTGAPWSAEQVLYHDALIQGAYEVHAFRTAPDTLAVVFLDITERKQAEEALRRSESRYRSLFERNLAGVYRSTADGAITECNDAMAVILGCSSPAEVMSRHAGEFYPSPEDRQRLLAHLLEAGELRNLELPLRRADGSTVWVLANMSLDRDGDGNRQVLEGTMIDITDHKRAVNRLLLQSMALESAANAIAVTDPDGLVVWVNPAFTGLTGYSAEEAAGQSLWLLKSGSSDDPMRADIAAALAEGRVWHGELVNRRKDGRLYTEELTVTPVRSADGSIDRLIAVQQDISERKRVEEQLQQAQKMEAVGRLAGGVAHDFNNLLQAMLGVTALLRQRRPGDDESASRLQELEEHVRRGSQLTRQLLLFSRRDTARQERLDLNDVVHGTVRLLHRLLRENIDLVFAPADIDLPLVADRGQIEQVVMNLALNACDAMPRGGRLFLQTGRETDRAWLEVADSGEGIPDGIRDQLFEPFFTTKEPGKGTGLGLSVVHSIVTRLGGAIDLESRVGEGTSIRISFPMVEPEAPDPRPAARTRSLEASEVEGQRILIVEDDPAVRSGLRELLRLLGYDVTSVGSREETIYLPPAPPFDLLLTDYVLPDGSGVEIARDLRARWPGLRVIIMSGYAQDVPLGQDLRVEGMEFLQKPFATDALANTVRAVLAEVPPDPPGA